MQVCMGIAIISAETQKHHSTDSIYLAKPSRDQTVFAISSSFLHVSFLQLYQCITWLSRGIFKCKKEERRQADGFRPCSLRRDWTLITNFHVTSFHNYNNTLSEPRRLRRPDYKCAFIRCKLMVRTSFMRIINILLAPRQRLWARGYLSI